MRTRKTKEPPAQPGATYDEMKRFIVNLGICPVCHQRIVHDMDEPFANCGCPGTMEWTSKPPLMMTLPDEITQQIVQIYAEAVGVKP